MSRAPAKRRKSRKIGPKGADTRHRLIEAAGKLFAQKGISASSLEEIAAAAGVTTGAIYDNFDGKEDLVYEEYKAHSTMSPPLFAAGSPFEEQAPRVRDKLIAMAAIGSKYVAMNAEMNYLLATREPLRRRILQLIRQRSADVEAELRTIPELQGLTLAPTEMIFTLALLYNGLVFHRLLMPEFVTEEMMGRAFDALLSGTMRPNARQGKRATKRKGGSRT